MKKTFKILLLVLLAVIVVHAVAVVVLYRRNEQLAKRLSDSTIVKAPMAWATIAPKNRVKIVSSLHFDEMTFKSMTLAECLEKLSGSTCELIGQTFSFSITVPAGCGADPDRLISLKLKNVTFAQILKDLGEASGATIEVKEGGVFVTYGKPQEKKP